MHGHGHDLIFKMRFSHRISSPRSHPIQLKLSINAFDSNNWRTSVCIDEHTIFHLKISTNLELERSTVGQIMFNMKLLFNHFVCNQLFLYRERKRLGFFFVILCIFMFYVYFFGLNANLFFVCYIFFSL